MLLVPSDDGYGSLTQHVWVCGKFVYLFLPPGWCGTCYMAALLPSIHHPHTITYNHGFYPHYHKDPRRVRRGTDPTVNTVTAWYEKMFTSIVPPYGIVKALHLIDNLHVAVESLTRLVDKGFDTLTVEAKALRTVALQTDLALIMLCGKLTADVVFL